MHKRWLKVALLLVALAGCSTTPAYQMQFYAGGEPSVKGAISTQSRLMVSITRAQARSVQMISTLTDVDLTLDNTTLLSSPQTAHRDLVGTTATAVFSALRPGEGYTLRVIGNQTANEVKTRVGEGFASDITLVAGQTKTVYVVIGLDGRIQVNTSTVGNTVGSNANWFIVKGDTVALRTGYNSSENLTGEVHAETLRVTLGETFFNDNTARVLATQSHEAGGLREYSWNTMASSGTYDPGALVLPEAGKSGTITFELLDGAGHVMGRTYLNNVTIVDGAGIDLQLNQPEIFK